MPFGSQPGASGRAINFDVVYSDIIRPAIESSGMEPIRGHEQSAGGTFRKPALERLLLCDFAVADLTKASAVVYYHLGIRHATRPRTTVLVVADGERVPFGVASDRWYAYQIGNGGRPRHVDESIAEISGRLEAARTPVAENSVYQLLGDWPGLPHSKTDLFRERVEGANGMQEMLESARSTSAPTESIGALRAIEHGLDVNDADAAVLVDLLLSYRSLSAWEDMIRLVDSMPPPLRSQTLLREQLGLALNRAGRSDDAERVLVDLVTDRGASPETSSILGRVYKDRYRRARASGHDADAHRYLRQAIDTYLRGFEADWRDAYPGINAIQLIHEADEHDARLDELIPVVEYAVRRKIASGNADYWDHATLIELAVLAGDRDEARSAAADARAAMPERWMLETTADTLRALADRTGAGWIADIEADLRRDL